MVFKLILLILLMFPFTIIIKLMDLLIIRFFMVNCLIILLNLKNYYY